jgi:glycine cleavage system H protein
MSNIPQDLKYTESHEWVRVEADGSITVGITEHAQDLLGDLVFVEIPKVGDAVNAGDACMVVESVKAASDVYAPVSGTVSAVNSALEGSPELINSDPYGEGWIIKVQMSNPADLAKLLDAAGYANAIGE